MAADADLHMQLAASVSVILNRCMGSPHLRIEFVNFMLHLVPQKKVPQGQEHNNRLYKDVFFHNAALQKHLMHALIVTYTDSEVTYWYTKFSYRYAAAYVMEYIWQDAGYRKSFVELSKNHPVDFNAFCNLLINDINSLLFDGLLALEEIKVFEDERESPVWNTYGEEEKQAKESNYAEKTRNAKAWLQLSNMVI